MFQINSYTHDSFRLLLQTLQNIDTCIENRKSRISQINVSIYTYISYVRNRGKHNFIEYDDIYIYLHIY